jgi:uncharacterized protein YegL
MQQPQQEAAVQPQQPFPQQPQVPMQLQQQPIHQHLDVGFMMQPPPMQQPPVASMPPTQAQQQLIPQQLQFPMQQQQPPMQQQPAAGFMTQPPVGSMQQPFMMQMPFGAHGHVGYNSLGMFGAPLPALRQKTTNFQDDDDIDVALVSGGAAGQPEADPAISSDGPLSLNTRVEYTALPRGQSRDVFGLVTVQAAEVDASTVCTDRQPMDMVCVLDVSGSMSGSKIRQVEDAMRFVIEQSDPRDRLSIVTFNHEAERQLPLRKMKPEGKDAANVTVLRLAAGGGTSIAEGLELGLQVMEQRRQRNKVSAILLLTDGQDGTAAARLPGLISRAEAARCALYTFGFGADHDAVMLGQIAEQARTPFSFVESTGANIREAFAGAAGGLTSVVAQDIQINLTSRVALKALHTPFQTSRVSDTQATVTIPDIFAGERRDILVELTVPLNDCDRGSKRVLLLTASAQYVDLQHGSSLHTPEATMSVEQVSEPQPEAEPDDEVSLQRERVEVARALQQATEDGNSGRFTDAQRTLEAAEQRLRPPATRSPATAVLGQQLQEVRQQMQNQSMWEQRGRAAVTDACSMHQMQRCTNMNLSAAQGMYCQQQQQQCINLSRR